MSPLRLIGMLGLAVAFICATDGPAWADEPTDPERHHTDEDAGVWLEVECFDDEVVRREQACDSKLAQRDWHRLPFSHGGWGDLCFEASIHLRPRRAGFRPSRPRDIRSATRWLSRARSRQASSEKPS